MKKAKVAENWRPTIYGNLDKNYQLSEKERNLGNDRIKAIFGISDNCFTEMRLDKNMSFDELRVILGFSHKSDRLKNTISLIISKFHDCNKKWKPRYNIIFFNVFNHGSFLTIENVSKYFLNKESGEITEKEYQVCLSIRIFAIIVNTNIKEFKNLPEKFLNSRLALPIFYAMIENMVRLLRIVFESIKIEFKSESILNEYRRFRNSIAHSSIAYEGENLVYLDFKTLGHLIDVKSVENLGTNVNEIFEEIKIIFILLSQIMELYQLTNQICRGHK